MLLFQNKGEIDPRAITAFGVSSKENASAIGFFGTGLKYAIAILLRNGCDITIFSGKKELTFSTRKHKIRVDEFQFVTMNNRRVEFTTDLGKTWEPWQAFRELYCNCVDEGGEIQNVAPGTVIEAEKGVTKILVTGAPIQKAWDERDSIILNSNPLCKSPGCEIHNGKSDYIFYRGVRAYKLIEPTLYTYNVTRKIDLTEDRTIKYLFEADTAIKGAVAECADPRMVEKVITAGEGWRESEFNFSGFIPSDVFLGKVKELSDKFDRRLNQSALEMCRPWILDSLPKISMELEAVEVKRLQKAIDFCKELGYPVDEFPIIVTEWLGEEVLGRAHEDRIYLSKRVFMMGTKMVAGTLLEEYIHLRHKVYDCTRTMQNFLMDAIVSLGEQITGEPL